MSELELERPATVPWAMSLPGASACLCFTPADPDRHAVLLHDWFHRSHVVAWWGEERTMAETHAYLVRQRQSPHLSPWFVSLWGQYGADDELFGYVETYRAAEDPLAQHTELDAGDRGWHVLVGLSELLGSGVPRLMGRAVMARLLTEPGARRVICEPNERNGRMIGFCRALGYEVVTTLDLPHKRALLLGCTREAFAARWPGDLEAGRASWATAADEG